MLQRNIILRTEQLNFGVALLYAVGEVGVLLDHNLVTVPQVNFLGLHGVAIVGCGEVARIARRLPVVVGGQLAEEGRRLVRIAKTLRDLRLFLRHVRFL